MTHLKAYATHLEDLVKCLPLDDSRFIIKLPSSLLPGDTQDQIKAQPSKADKALYFLSTVIKPALDVGDTSGFDTLISVMENCGFNNVELVAEKIKSEIDNSSGKKSAKPGKQTGGKKKRKRSTSENSGDMFEPVKKGRRRSTSESNDSDDGFNEKVFSKVDGKGYGFEKDRDEKKKAVCIVYPPNGQGTGFFGSYGNSVVLVTNYHVMINGIDDEKKYQKARNITSFMKEKILKHVNKCDIKVEGKKIRLSKELIVEDGCEMSSDLSLDYCIIRLDEAELKKKLPNGFSTINLNHPGCVNDNDQIQIFQHPHGHPLSSSMSSCRIIELHKPNRTGLLIYRSGTDPGSSGGPILKLVNGDFVIVGLHRGGYRDNWDGNDAKGFNYGTLFSDIITSIEENWQPRVPNIDDIDDKECIYRALKKLE